MAQTAQRRHEHAAHHCAASQTRSSKGQQGRAYAVRFGFGGLVSAVTGFLGHVYGPTVGGLFLAFPAILPASLTLIKKHKGEEAAGDDAAGAVAGSAGLAVFGALVWLLAPRLAAWQVLALALLVWLAVGVAVWWCARQLGKRGRAT